MQQYDLVVIGSGPGGQRAAIQAAKAKKRVAVVEKQTMVGGVCINTGTIPSKTMREAVLHLSGFYDQAFYGSNYHVKENITMNDLNFRVTRVIENEAAVLQDQLKRNGVDLYHGVGAFTDPHHIRVENTTGFNELEAEFIVIATGTKPAVNPKVAINGRNIVNSDQILGIPTVPKTLIVVGGGVIGVEYACMFTTLGVRVIIVEKRPRLLEFADAEVVEALSYHMRDRRATMRLNEEVESVEELPDGKVAASLVSNKRIVGDALLYAVGRKGIWPARGIRSCRLSLRDLHDSANLLHRQDGRTVDRGGCAIRSGRRLLPRNRARTNQRAHRWPLEAAVPPPDAGTPWRAHFRGRRDGTSAHRSGGFFVEGQNHLFHQYGLQLPHAGGVLQGGGIQRPEPAGLNPRQCE